MSDPFSSLSPGARMMIGMGIGDASGSRYENTPHTKIPSFIDLETLGNRYTDDTQMAAGIALAMLSEEPFSPENLARSLIGVYRRDPRGGYSPLTRSMLEESPDEHAFLTALPQEERLSRKTDGAAMRALPLGFYPDTREVIRNAAMSAMITHAHPDSVLATTAIALISHFRYYYRYQFGEIPQKVINKIIDANMVLDEGIMDYLDQVISLSSVDPRTILRSHADYGVPYAESRYFLGAVLNILTIHGEDPRAALVECIRLGGDTDTSAAVVLGAALIYPGRASLPENLFSGLERGIFGRDFLIDIGDRLTSRYPVIST